VLVTNRDSLRRYVLLGTLYFAQGLPFGFFVQAVPILLRKQGYSLTAIGSTALLTLPWALKFVWAPVVDRYYSKRIGRRRTWILSMQLAATLVLGAIALAPGSDDLSVLMAAMAVLNLIAATQDIATDGLAVELLPPEERGFANGLQVAGYRVGMIVGGGVLFGVYVSLGHHNMFGVMAALTALASVPVLLSREPATVARSAASRDSVAASTAGEAVPALEGAPTAPSAAEQLRVARHFLGLRGVWPVLAMIALYKFGEASAQSLLPTFLHDAKISDQTIAVIRGTVGFLAGMGGALVGGLLVTRLGRKHALVAFGCGQVFAVSGYSYLAFTSPSLVELYVWAGVEHFASGMATAALFTSMMDWSRPASSGTDYTVMASTVVISTGLAAVLGGASADALGYGWHFVVAASVCAIATFAVTRLYPSTFPREEHR
jgi:PAT family beta-lactamase induction signal transducer AmpG